MHSILVSLFLLPFFFECIRAVVHFTNDGPVTVETPITFTVKLDSYSILPTYSYKFSFDEFPDRNTNIYKNQAGPLVYSIVFNVSEHSNMGPFTAKVEVWYCILQTPFILIGSESTSFTLSKSLIGTIDFYQEGLPQEAKERKIISTSRDTNLTALIRDPTGFFSGVNVTYKWEINDELITEGEENSILHNFTALAIHNVSVVVKAPGTDHSQPKSGLLTLSLTSNDPIKNLSLLGKTFVHRDETLDLQIDVIGGTLPHHFCWEMINTTVESYSVDKQRNCGFTNDGHIPILRYFSSQGKYNFTISVDNAVSIISHYWSISIFEVEHKGQLSFVLIPVCSIILAIVIMIGGIAIHMRQRRELTVEVADFDFQSYEDLMEKTFLERIKENLTQSIKKSFYRRPGYDEFTSDANDAHIGECNLRFSGELEDSGVSDVRT
ncbi:transmembrane protein 130 isoform X2 [Brevipalpus obovatus]|uniref:transmembrane protein 130 isoform X2 n=1 Tax=Brevipalpus obovatus TaxID=246614 RepID=UPI003D9E7FFF